MNTPTGATKMTAHQVTASPEWIAKDIIRMARRMEYANDANLITIIAGYITPTPSPAPQESAKGRVPRVVNRKKDDKWDVCTSPNEVDGSYWLDSGLKWRLYRVDSSVRGLGNFDTESEARAALAKAPPVPEDAVWDDEPNSPATPDSSPSAGDEQVFRWHPIAELDVEKVGKSELILIAPYPQNPQGWNTIYATHAKNERYVTHFMLITPPKPTPTLAELEKAFTDAIESETDFYRSQRKHHPDEPRWKGSDVADKLAAQTDAARSALLSARAKQGGSQ